MISLADKIPVQPPLLRLTEAAAVLRCSKAHLSNVIQGKVPGLPPLPVVRIGRRLLVRHDTLVEWLKAVEGQARRVL